MLAAACVSASARDSIAFCGSPLRVPQLPKNFGSDAISDGSLRRCARTGTAHAQAREPATNTPFQLAHPSARDRRSKRCSCKGSGGILHLVPRPAGTISPTPCRQAGVRPKTLSAKLHPPRANWTSPKAIPQGAKMAAVLRNSRRARASVQFVLSSKTTVNGSSDRCSGTPLG